MSVASNVVTSSAVKASQSESAVPKSNIAKATLSSLKRLIPEARFRKEFIDPASGKLHVVLKIPSRKGRTIRVEYILFTEEQLKKIKRSPREQYFPRLEHPRYPRLKELYPGVRRFPRLANDKKAK
jgi:hypothetical protein